MELQEKLTQFRKDKGLSQMEVAEELGVSRQAVSRWETGAAVPSSSNLICLSKLYGVSLDELVEEKQAEGPPEASPPPDAEELPEIRPDPVELEPPDKCADTEETAASKYPNKKPVGLIVFICICGILLLWGWLTNSMVIAKSLLVCVTILFTLGWFLVSLHMIVNYLRKDNNKK